MADTTLTNLINTLRIVSSLPDTQINFGVVSQLSPPYVTVANYQAEYDYDTGGPRIKNTKFSVLVVAKNYSDCEKYIAEIADYLTNNVNINIITPNSIGIIQDGYTIGQMETLENDKPLFQIGGKLDYTLMENVNGSTI